VPVAGRREQAPARHDPAPPYDRRDTPPPDPRASGAGFDPRDPAPPYDRRDTPPPDPRASGAAFDPRDPAPPVDRSDAGRPSPEPEAESTGGARRTTDRGPARRKRRRATIVLLAVLLLGGVVAGGAYTFLGWFIAPDFEGTGVGDVVVQVEDGDSTTRIAGVLAANGVVASAAAFTNAADDDERIRAVQPGYYQLRRQMSGASAVALMLDPASRVGQLEIRGGVQLDDTSAPDGSVAPGVLSLISQATCVRQDGEERCVSVDELRASMSETDPATLGVPEWALEDVAEAEPRRRLEGLLVPGRYDVHPGSTAVDVLKELLATSAARLEATGLVSGARSIGTSPYEVLTIASLVEKEAITPDMPQVARVIYNRLGAGRRLELDSMVNYPLDLQALRTTAEDRTRPGPYNSYVVTGLPPTPIAAAGREAIAAALEPVAGPWMYFVRCQADGTSCFAETYEEHDANVREARANGAF
jgi:UPF0755 protein